MTRYAQALNHDLDAYAAFWDIAHADATFYPMGRDPLTGTPRTSWPAPGEERDAVLYYPRGKQEIPKYVEPFDIDADWEDCHS